MSTVKSSSADLTLNAEGAGNDVIIQGNGTNTATVTAEGLMQFNSGYGSVATAYGCRAWVNFNGTSTVAISASGNVSSITDNSTGNYTVNFTTAMSDANYSVSTLSGANGQITNYISTLAAGSARVVTYNPHLASPIDQSIVCVAVFR
jgi:uncharacterized protein (AIM24 family)